eukprot:gene9137-biopygen21204
MGLGPHPVERARSGGAEGAQRPLKKRPHRLEATKSGYYMSGVGAPFAKICQKTRFWHSGRLIGAPGCRKIKKKVWSCQFHV